MRHRSTKEQFRSCRELSETNDPVGGHTEQRNAPEHASLSRKKHFDVLLLARIRERRTQENIKEKAFSGDANDVSGKKCGA